MYGIHDRDDVVPEPTRRPDETTPAGPAKPVPHLPHTRDYGDDVKNTIGGYGISDEDVARLSQKGAASQAEMAELFSFAAECRRLRLTEEQAIKAWNRRQARRSGPGLIE